MEEARNSVKRVPDERVGVSRPNKRLFLAGSDDAPRIASLEKSRFKNPVGVLKVRYERRQSDETKNLGLYNTGKSV